MKATFLLFTIIIFLPRINISLDAFQNGWNEPGVRTEGHYSLLQLYHAGTLRLQNYGLEAMDLYVDLERHALLCYTAILPLVLFFEHCGLSDPVNKSHIFALHYIFLPRINSSLDAFRNG